MKKFTKEVMTGKQMFYHTVNWSIAVVLVGIRAVLPASAQRIGNIRPVAHHDTIVITYDLVGTQPGDQFQIKAFCWDGYEETPLTAVGGRTVVGRGTHQLEWRVLQEPGRDLLVGDSITFTLEATRFESASATPSALTTDDKKKQLFSQLTGQVDSYLEQLYNQSVLFRDFGERPFTSNSGYAKLDEQTKRLNKAYETLLENRRTFEATSSTLWGSSAGTLTKDFFRNLFDVVHRDALKSYNDVLKMMNDVVYHNYQGRRRSELVQDIQQRIYQLTHNAEAKINLLKGDAQEVYRQLPL